MDTGGIIVWCSYWFLPQSTAQMSHIISQNSDLAGANAECWIIPDVQHLGGIFNYPEEYANRIIHFFNKNLVEPFPDSDPQ
jgi:hypothetical protein